MGIVSGVSVSHESASIELIESLAVPTSDVVEHLLSEPGVSEAVALSTCNRFEAYVVTNERAAGRTALDDQVAAAPADATRELDHEESLRHLMRVAAGLESLVLGEDQILGQVREAYTEARDAGGVDRILDDALMKALHVGERARSETAINEGIVSLGSAAVELARQERPLLESTALVVGAGEMGSIAAAALADAVDELVVANRTVERAEQIAADFRATAVGLDALPSAVEAADVVVTATGSPDYVVDEEVLAGAGETFLVDIGQPRDVAPAAADRPGATVRDLDALESVTDRTRDQRREAAEAVEAIIDEELDHLLTQYKRKRADQVIAAMYEGAERMKEAELRKARSQLEAADTPGERRAVLDSLADALVGQLLAAPTRSLRDAAEHDDWETIHTALQLFDPRVDVASDELPESMRQGMPPGVVERFTGDD